MYNQAFLADVWPIITTTAMIGSDIYSGRVYDRVAPKDTTFPALVYQSQDLGGFDKATLNTNGWQGLITLRSMASNSTLAASLLSQFLSRLGSNVTISGIVSSGVYNVSMRPVFIAPLPVERFSDGAIYTSAVVVDFWITPSNSP